MDGQIEAGEGLSGDVPGAEGGVAQPLPATGGYTGGATFAAVAARNEQQLS